LLGDEPVKISDINRVVRQKIQENNKLIISVKSHEKTKYKDYISVIDQLKMANATRISIAETQL
jgi:biopolymer transport protein ExbD